MKDGLKSEHAVDFDTDVATTRPVHSADACGITTPAPTMAQAHESLPAVGLASTLEDSALLQPTRIITRAGA